MPLSYTKHLTVLSVFIFSIVLLAAFKTSLFTLDMDFVKAGGHTNKSEVEKYFDEIQNLCGDLCDLEKEIVPGDFMGSVRAEVDCDRLFQTDLLVPPPAVSRKKPPPWSEAGEEYRNLLTHGGQVYVKEFYFDETNMGSGRNEATVFSSDVVQNMVNKWKSRTHENKYDNCSELTDQAAEVVDVRGKTILVIGSQTPWLEAVLFARNPKKVVTLEYGYFISHYPNHHFIRPKEFRERFLNRTLDKFDAVFTFSSIEHSGLGRYGDPLNPWGDIISIAQAWCVSTPDAKLAIAVPTNITGKDRIEFNAHKVYGPKMYPFLVTNWKFMWPLKAQATSYQPGYQPVFVFEKESVL